MPDQNDEQSSAEDAHAPDQSLTSGKILRTLMWVLPLVVVIVVVVLVLLAQLGPATDNLYSNIVTTL